ncbi:MAG TPA: lysophospholipid acyltransferase family protein [Gallionellaceae bacterium]
MSSSFVVWLFDLLARLPLSFLHRLGTLLGWVIYLMSGPYAGRLRDNLGHAHDGMAAAEFRPLLRASVAEAGKSVAELPWLWRRPVVEVLQAVRLCHGFAQVEAACNSGKGVIFLTPHMGCFEIISLYVAAQYHLTIMYRPAKLTWLDRVMREGRQRGKVTLARTDIGGVRAMYKTLKRGESIGLLPDQVPGNGEGEWAEFFGRQAYTMTLVGRLAESSGATVMMSYAIRLPKGAGYDLYFEPLELAPDVSVALQINRALEKVVRTCPSQYLWSYNRYKVPAGITAPQQGGDA